MTSRNLAVAFGSTLIGGDSMALMKITSYVAITELLIEFAPEIFSEEA